MKDKTDNNVQPQSEEIQEDVNLDELILDQESELPSLNKAELSPEEEITKLKDQLLRMAAELDNARKRFERDLENARKYGNERAISSVVPVRDSLDLAIQTSVQDLPETVKKGIEATIKLFDDTLIGLGVTVLNPVGRTFDPSLHEAILMQDSDDKEAGTIIDVVQKGFQLYDRILRPARVVVAKKP
jgi:molecular chaperone GrpE